MPDLADFVLDFCRAHSAVVEPPAYGVYDVLLPDTVAAQLGIEPFQRFAFDEPAAAEGATVIAYGHPLAERMIELTRAAPACARFYINDVRLDKSGLAALARAALAFPNANLVEVPRTLEARALFRYVRFNFKAALVSDEKREQLVSVLVDAQSGAAVPDFSFSEPHRLAEAPAFTDLPLAPASWTTAPDPLAPKPLRALLDRAARAAVDSLAPVLAGLQARAARHLELDRARLDAYYADLERDLERRLMRAQDEKRSASLESKLAATRTDHAAKLEDAEAKYRLRVELDLVNLALIAQPKLTLSIRIENRQAGVTRSVVWDSLRHVIEPLICDVCFRPRVKLFLCANNHLACGECLAPQCVDCKRVYCQACASEVRTCVVCHRPVCQKSLTRCRECGQGTCREHASLCHRTGEAVFVPAADHAADQIDANSQPPPEISTPAPVAAAPSKPRQSQTKRTSSKRKAPLPPSVQPAQTTDYRLEVEVRTDEPLVVAFVLTKGKHEVAQRVWKLTDEGITVACFCEKGWKCRSAARLLKPESPARIESQLEAEIDKFRAEYRIAPYRAAIYIAEHGEFVRRPRLRLRGRWKEGSLLEAAPATARVEESPSEAALIRYPDWVLAFTPEEAEHFMPDIERFIRIAHGWLFYEGALRAHELASLTASVARPGAWYSPKRAPALFKADPRLGVARGNVISIGLVHHPLKVLREKEARRLPPRAFSAEELSAAAEGQLSLTPREAEIENALNQRTSRKVDLHTFQSLFRNTDDPSTLFSMILERCAPRDEQEASALAGLLSELWNNTPRFELRGRTPDEVVHHREATSADEPIQEKDPSD